MRAVPGSRVPFPVPAEELVLGAGEVHVWHLELRPPARELERMRGWIDRAESDRAARFVFDRDRLRYIAAHGLLRHLLGGYLGTAPEAVELAVAPRGKPYLLSPAGRDSNAALRFNLAHSGDRALVAVSSGREVGVDVEEAGRGRDVVGIAGSFFSPAEVAALKAVPDAERVAAFYRCWTRKEAYIKACGTGLAMRLDSFDVSLEPDACDALLRSERGVDEPRRWKLVDLPVDGGFTAALAVEGHDWRLVTRTLDFARDPDR